MKRIALASAALLAIAAASCNPFGMDETKVYVNGIIYTDSTHSLPAEGVAVIITKAAETYLSTTDAGGMFHFEIQIYAGGGPKGVDGPNVTFGILAVNNLAEYTYIGDGGSYTIEGGDTLSLYPIDLTMFKYKETAPK